MFSLFKRSPKFRSFPSEQAIYPKTLGIIETPEMLSSLPIGSWIEDDDIFSMGGWIKTGANEWLSRDGMISSEIHFLYPVRILHA